MALIKCEECGEKISDKADACIHCGCPIKKEIQKKEVAKKKWLELNESEVNKVTKFRKQRHQYWEINRILTLAIGFLSLIMLLLFFLTGFNIIFMIFAIVCVIVAFLFLRKTSTVDETWYNEHIDKIYEKGILK